jgi:hypothetical protein
MPSCCFYTSAPSQINRSPKKAAFRKNPDHIYAVERSPAQRGYLVGSCLRTLLFSSPWIGAGFQSELVINDR